MLSVLGGRRRREAERAWEALQRVPASEGVEPLQAAGVVEARRPLPRLRLRAVVPDVFLIDAALPGVG